MTRKYRVASLAIMSRRFGILNPGTLDLITRRTIKANARRSGVSVFSGRVSAAMSVYLRLFQRTIQEGDARIRDIVGSTLNKQAQVICV